MTVIFRELRELGRSMHFHTVRYPSRSTPLNRTSPAAAVQCSAMGRVDVSVLYV